MKKRAALLLCAAALMLTLCSCGPAPVAVDDGSAYDGPTGGGYDYDKGCGYTAPEPGQSFSDYVKEQDTELYESLFN